MVMNENKIILRKHRSIIQMQNLDAVARKAYNVLLHNAYLNRCDDYYTIGLSELKEKAGIKDTSNANIKKHILSMMKTIVEMDILAKTEEWKAMALLQDVSIKDGVFEYSLPRMIRSALFEPDKYATIDLTIIKGLRSKYAIALYELAMDYKKKEIPKMSIEDFRKLMGVEQDKYRKSFTDLERYVIKRAVDEINNNENIDFKIDYEKIWNGKKIAGIKFKIKRKKKNKSKDDDKDLKDFVDTLRNAYLGQSVFVGNLDGEIVDLAINREGHLYDAINLKKFNKEAAFEIYKKLYDLAKTDEEFAKAIKNCKTYKQQTSDEIEKEAVGCKLLYREMPCIITRAYKLSDNMYAIDFCLEDRPDINYSNTIEKDFLAKLIDRKKSAQVEHKK